MKNRSHRLPMAETDEDWVDESWTVDCICGVNFDDGEEMVNCDVCGVWVHTRCSRYVKTKKSFSCDKCKRKNSRNNESEETEVAQLLVDLPNKTLGKDNLYPINGPSRMPGKLYTQISTEKTVHVHGVPGGDPSLFAGLSPVFSPELWKCTGHVPKKFNFQYKEFPPWDEKETEQVERRNHEDADNAARKENTAGVLFSLLRDSASLTPLGRSEDVKCLVEDGATGKGENLEHIKSTGKNKESSFAKNAVENCLSLPQAAVVETMKRKKKDRGTSMDRRERKRTGMHENGKDSEKKGRITSKTDGHDVETEMFDSSRCYTSSGRLKYDNTGDQRESKIENSHQVNEVASGALDSPNGNGGRSAQRMMAAFQKAQPVVEHLAVASREATDSKNIQGLIGDVASFSVPNTGEKRGAYKNLDVHNVTPSPSSEEKLEGIKLLAQLEESAIDLTEDVRSDLAISSSEVSDQMQDGDKNIAGGDYGKDYTLADGCQSKLELPTGSGFRDGSSGHNSGSTSSDGSLGGRESSSQLKTGSKHMEGVCKLGARTYLSDPKKLKVLVGKSSSETCKSSTSGSPSPRTVPSLTTCSKQRGMLSDNVGSRRDDLSYDGIKDEGRIERSKKIKKDIPKSSISPFSNGSQSSRLLHAPISKGRSSYPKESSLHSSPDVLANSATAVPGIEESTNSVKNAGGSAHNKVAGSGLQVKSEKASHPDSQPSSKGNSSQNQPPASSIPPSGLSDEELALLLHQELNSSPRVPRVPRMRHAGSLPQLTSPTAASMLMKRTSSSGGQDFSFSSRRKSKEARKDAALSTRNVPDEAKKVERVSPSPDHRGKDSEITTTLLTSIGESVLPKGLVRKNKRPASTATTGNGLSSSTEVNEHQAASIINSPRHTSDGDSGTVGRPLTLPGLISKIMSKGERMTLEELCDFVLPHWPHLRKNNGDRYAYSSHSHAVLDCLRNRHEWARLVDRGPKTSTSKKRRKPGADPSDDESEDNVRREITAKDGRSKSIESQREEIPKGKRQARKRRRLALHGRGITELRRRRRVELVTDDDDDSLSNSSEDSKFSEDEMQGDGTSGTNEASAGSDETSN